LPDLFPCALALATFRFEALLFPIERFAVFAIELRLHCDNLRNIAEL